MQQASFAGGPPAKRPRLAQGGPSSRVDQFLWESGVDESAAQALRELDHASQMKVIAVGSLQGGKNPSAMLIGRVRDVKRGSLAAAPQGMMMHAPAYNDSSDEVEQFIHTWGVDDA